MITLGLNNENTTRKDKATLLNIIVNIVDKWHQHFQSVTLGLHNFFYSQSQK